MDFSNLSRVRNRNNSKPNAGGTSASDFDPSETKQLKNPRVATSGKRMRNSTHNRFRKNTMISF
jgi:hypothetical protein